MCNASFYKKNLREIVRLVSEAEGSIFPGKAISWGQIKIVWGFGCLDVVYTK